MAIATRTLSVNPAFLQEIKQDNIELRSLLEEMTHSLCRRRPLVHDPKRLVGMLEQLRDQLAMHFALEEAFGYFEDAVNAAPQLCRHAEELQMEHKLFFCDICRLVEQAERAVYGEADSLAIRQLAVRFAAFHDAFKQHEARERELIMDAFEQDLGCGD